jgi:hypothetical protein
MVIILTDDPRTKLTAQTKERLCEPLVGIVMNWGEWGLF